MERTLSVNGKKQIPSPRGKRKRGYPSKPWKEKEDITFETDVKKTKVFGLNNYMNFLL